MATDKRITHVRKVYEYDDGSEGRSAKPNWTALRFEALAPEKDAEDNFIVLDQRRITREDAQKWETSDCAMGHGYSQKVGDDLAGLPKKAKEDGASFDDERGYADYAMERVDAMLDNFANGIWVTESEGGSGAGSVTILFTAICKAYENGGAPLDEEAQATIRQKLKDEEFRKNAAEVAEVKAVMEEIKAERAAERAKKAREAAQGGDGNGLAALMGSPAKAPEAEAEGEAEVAQEAPKQK